MPLAEIARAIYAPVRALRVSTLLAFAAVLGAGIFVIRADGAHAVDANLRYERIERLGAETASRDVTPMGNSAFLHSDDARQRISATWIGDRYEWSRMLPRARACKMNLYVTGPALQAASRSAYVDILLDGIPVAHVGFSRQRPYGLRAPPEIRPVGLDVRSVPFSALTAPLADVFALPPSACGLDRFDVTIVAKGASWIVDRVGLIAEFTPQRPSFGLRLFFVACLALAVLLIGLYALLAALVSVERVGGLCALALAVVVLALSPLLHDEWDSVIWLRFVDLVAFAGASPAPMWLGTPLWPVGVTILSPILYVSYALTNNGGQELTMHLLKSAMALGFVANAALAASLAPARFRSYFTFLMLLAPVGLYEVAGGYRETFAVTFALAAFLALRGGRFVLASIAFALAASISESLIVLVALPAMLDFARPALPALRIRRAATALAAAVATIVVQYLVLTPSGFAGHIISTRVVAYRYGGASWFSVAEAYHVLPPWVGPQSIAIVVALFLILALPLIAVTVSATRGPQAERSRRIGFAFLGFTAATFLAYRGIDPNDWYALFAVTVATFARFEPQSPLPLLLGVLQGLGFYTIVGIADFVDDRFFAPADRGIFGTLGGSMLVSNLVINAVIVALYLACVSGSSRYLFGRHSYVFAILFAGAIAASASQAILTDALIVGAGAALAVVMYARLIRLAHRRAPSSKGRRLEAALATAIVSAGLLFAGGDVAATTIALIAFAIALIYGVTVVDTILAVGCVAFYTSETHFGWVSIIGFLTLSLVGVVTISAFYRLIDDARSARAYT